MIIGRHLAAARRAHRTDAPGRPDRRRRTGLRGGDAARASRSTVHAGEVLGVTGLIGSGYEDLVYVSSGAPRAPRATWRSATEARCRRDADGALGAGLALIPADRRATAASAPCRSSDNMTLQVARRVLEPRSSSRAQCAARPRAARAVRRAPADPGVLTQSLRRQPAEGRCWRSGCRPSPPLLLLHEPTQGVDVGARRADLPDAPPRRRGSAAGASSARAATTSSSPRLCDRVLVFGAAVASSASSTATRSRRNADRRAVLRQHGKDRG